MTHPEILAEDDWQADIRWVTVNGRHIPFWKAGWPVDNEGQDFPGEAASPDNPRWAEFKDYPEDYAVFKARLAKPN